MNLRRRAAWSVPLVTAGVVVAAGLLPQATAVGGQPDLPARSAAELLVAVQNSSTTALSGTVVQTARLGLPPLPGARSSAELSLTNLAAGSHTAQVWVDGRERQRVALLGSLSESDVVHNGRDVWTYSSSTRTATHTVLPERPPGTDAEAPADARQLTPQAAADRALAAIDPTTLVSVDETGFVADRPVYTLRLAPRDTASTVRSVLLAVDAATSVPLRVQVFGASAEPAVETGFTSVSFDRPPASVFAFTPPAAATVEERGTVAPRSDRDAPDAGSTAAPTVIGKGWTSIVELEAGTRGPQGSGAATFERLTTVQPDGSRLLRTALVNALFTPDGRILAGAVTPEALQRAAAR